jgi:hypothetical protein
MNSREWDMYGWLKFKNPSGEICRKKQYGRYMLTFSNDMPNVIKQRKALAKILQVPENDLMGELSITINITKYKHLNRLYKLKKYQRYING